MSVRLPMLKMMNDCFRELTKFVQMVCADLIDDSPVYRLIAVDGDIPEPNSFCEAFSQSRSDDVKIFENCEVLGHRGRRDYVSLGDQMRGDVDGKLDGALEIQCNDVLGV